MDVTHDWELSKENILPVKEGRKFEVLNAVLSEAEEKKLQLKKEEQQKIFESELQNYTGNDPLDVWYRYIVWYQENYPQGQKGLKELVVRCLEKMRSTQQYVNDARLLHVWIKYGECKNRNVPEIYSSLHGRTYFKKLAEFYIHWARALEDAGNVKDATATFKVALNNGAEPKDQLELAQKNFEARVACSLANTCQTEPEIPPSPKEKRSALGSIGMVGSTSKAPVVRGGAPVTRITNPSARSTGKAQNLVIPVFRDENNPVDVIASIQTTEDPSLPVIKGESKENTQQPEKWGKPSTAHQEVEIPSTQTFPAAPAFEVFEDECASAMQRKQAPSNRPAAVLRDKAVPTSAPAPEVFLRPADKPTEKFMCNMAAIYNGSSEFSFEQLRALKYQPKECVNTQPAATTKEVGSSNPAAQGKKPESGKERIMCILGNPEQSVEELRAAAYNRRQAKKTAIQKESKDRLMCDPRVYGDVEISFEELRARLYPAQKLQQSAEIPHMKTEVKTTRDMETQTEIAGIDLIFQVVRPDHSRNTEANGLHRNDPLTQPLQNPSPAIPIFDQQAEAAPLSGRGPSFAVFSDVPAQSSSSEPSVRPNNAGKRAPLSLLSQSESAEARPAEGPVSNSEENPGASGLAFADDSDRNTSLPSPTVHTKAAASLFREWLSMPVRQTSKPASNAPEKPATFEIFEDPSFCRTKPKPSSGGESFPQKPATFDIFADPSFSQSKTKTLSGGESFQDKRAPLAARGPREVVEQAEPVTRPSTDIEMEEVPQKPFTKLPIVGMDKWDEYMESADLMDVGDENKPVEGFKLPPKRQTAGVLVPSADIPFDPRPQFESEEMLPAMETDDPRTRRCLFNDSVTQIVAWQDKPFSGDITVPSLMAFSAFARTTSTPFHQPTSSENINAATDDEATANIIMKPRERKPLEAKTPAGEIQTSAADATAPRWTTCHQTKLLSPIDEISRESYSSSGSSGGTTHHVSSL